jgi:putative SOS response-associated peptidase YedK
MCGRYGFIPTKEFSDRFELANAGEFRWEPSYNIAPSSVDPVITMNSPKKVRLMKWGLVPSWWKKDPKQISFSNINARIEDIETKPVFRSAFKKNRCLIPASFFYEWALTADPKVKEPYVFRLKSKEMFAFAGIFDQWNDVEGHIMETYSIITCPPNKTVGKVHTRMPVILKKENEDEWADNANFDPVVLKGICQPFPESEMEGYHVNRRVGNAREDGPELIRPEGI